MAKSKFDLAALIREQQGNVSESDTGEVRQIPVELLDDNADNFYSVSDLEGLVDSISVSGVLQPILVTPIEGGRYRIIAGHRRTAAVRQLRAELIRDSSDAANERYSTIPAMVRTAAASETDRLLEKLALIATNSAARRLSDSEIAKQAAQMQEILVGLKAQGFQFPGRMRRLVADAVGVSETKLARLKGIREGLIPDWSARWEAGQVTEYAAEALSKQPAAVQEALLPKEKVDPFSVSVASDLHRATGADKQCEVMKDRTCVHCDDRRREGMRRLIADNTRSCILCCRYCYLHVECNATCQIAEDDRRAAEQKRNAEYREQQEAEQAKREAASALQEQERQTAVKMWARVTERMISLGLDANDLGEAALTDDVDMLYKLAVDRSELGGALEECILPIEFFAADQLLDVARTLDVPLEWLVDPDMEALPSSAGVGWQDAARVHPDEGDMVLILRHGKLIDWKHDPHVAVYRGGQYFHFDAAAADLEWQDVRYWAPWPGGVCDEM